MDILLEDVHTLRTQVQKDYPDLPYFILGHSMGSYILRKYLCLHGTGLSGAIVMGTGFIDSGVTHAGLLMCRLLTLLKGEKERSAFITKLTFGSGGYRKFCMDGSDDSNSWLTKDTAIVRKYYQDPLCTFRFTLNGYQGLLETVLYDCTAKHLARMDRNIPVLLVSGSEDPVGDMGAGVRKVYEMFREAGMKDVKMRLFEGDRHEILNETDRETVVYPELLGWLDAHL